MSIKVKITGKTEFYHRSEYYDPDEEIVVKLDVDSIDDVTQEMIAEHVSDISWQLSRDEDYFDEEEYYFDQVDDDDDDDDDEDDEDDEDEDE